jgi:ATP-binding protein involved in chromosome partitioning
MGERGLRINRFGGTSKLEGYCGGAMVNNISLQNVQEAIGKVTHPAISRTLVDLGMVKDIRLHGKEARLTLFLPVLSIPVPVKDYLTNSLREAVAALDVRLEVEIAQMNDEERQAFLAMEQESWKGL